MTAQIAEGAWTPLPGSLPERVDPSTVYVIPTREPAKGSDVPRYMDIVRYLPKEARAAAIPVEFSRATGARAYLSEFSVDPETWSLGLACLQMANEWLILTVSLFISFRSKAQGWTEEEAQNLPLRVLVAETETGRNYVIEGSGTDVIEALKVLQSGAGQ
jgi:hypothetical protein